VTLLETTAAGPYYFNFHQGDLGNFTVIGPSGSGKTVVLNFLLAQARKFAPRIIFFDKDRGAELFLRAIGGRYDQLRPGTASGLNPLQLDDTPANRHFLIDWIALLAGGADIEETARIKDAVDANFDQPHEHRRLRYLPSCSAAAIVRMPPISGRGCAPGGGKANAPGCSTIRATKPISPHTRSGST
jgi:type IV secretion system protein VirB4